MKHFCLFILVAVAAASLGAVQVSGNVNGMWAAINNPYEVVGNLTVPAGQALAIEPGVLIQITGNYQFTVAGMLQCHGTPADSIRILNTQASLWQGMRFESTTQTSSIRYTYIEKATYGIRCMNAILTVKHNRINLCEKGMELYAIGAATPNAAVVDSNLIENCTQNGILVTQHSGATITHNEIRGNGTGAQFRAAIQLANQSTGGNCNPIIANNHIHHNLKQGISAWDVSSSGAINPQILNNVIEYNYTGVYLLQASGYVADNQINFNFIPGDMNSGAGVMVSGVTAQPYFERNHVEGNFTGFYVTNNGKPVLGDLADNSAWAQGENVIVNNIDANNVLHSVFCDTYPNAAFIIKAENNNWGAATAEEIAVGINDHNDNPALPTVDFDPFLMPTLPTSIVGTYEYNGQFAVANARLELISPATGAALFTLPLPSTTIEVSVPVDSTFYAQVVLQRQDGQGQLFGCAGGYLNPTLFAPGDFAPVDIGTVSVSDTPPPRYEKIGQSIQENGITLYPILNGLGLYSWRNLDWVYTPGDDFLYLKRNVRRTTEGEQVTNLPDGSIYTKYQNISANDLWNEVRVNDDGSLQTQIIAEHFPCSTFLNLAAYSVTIRRIATNRTLDKLMQTPEGDWLYRIAENGSLNAKELVLRVGTVNELGLPPLKLFVSQELSTHPTYLGFDPDLYNDPDNTWDVHLTWEPPAGGNWTHFQIFRNEQMVAEVPLTTSEYHDTQWNPNLGTTSYVVCAWDGTNLSEPTNSVIVIITANDDQLVAPVQLSCYPNPLPQGTNLQISLGNLKHRQAELTLYNLKGQRVYQATTAAETCLWNGRDLKGNRCGAGIYFLRVKVQGEPEQKRKLVLQ